MPGGHRQGDALPEHQRRGRDSAAFFHAFSGRRGVIVVKRAGARRAGPFRQSAGPGRGVSNVEDCRAHLMKRRERRPCAGGRGRSRAPSPSGGRDFPRAGARMTEPCALGILPFVRARRIRASARQETIVGAVTGVVSSLRAAALRHHAFTSVSFAFPEADASRRAAGAERPVIAGENRNGECPLRAGGEEREGGLEGHCSPSEGGKAREQNFPTWYKKILKRKILLVIVTIVIKLLFF